MFKIQVDGRATSELNSRLAQQEIERLAVLEGKLHKAEACLKWVAWHHRHRLPTGDLEFLERIATVLGMNFDEMIQHMDEAVKGW